VSGSLLSGTELHTAVQLCPPLLSSLLLLVFRTCQGKWQSPIHSATTYLIFLYLREGPHFCQAIFFSYFCWELFQNLLVLHTQADSPSFYSTEKTKQVKCKATIFTQIPFFTHISFCTLPLIVSSSIAF
jgi:hypothetical protein